MSASCPNTGTRNDPSSGLFSAGWWLRALIACVIAMVGLAILMGLVWMPAGFRVQAPPTAQAAILIVWGGAGVLIGAVVAAAVLLRRSIRTGVREVLSAHRPHAEPARSSHEVAARVADDELLAASDEGGMGGGKLIAELVADGMVSRSGAPGFVLQCSDGHEPIAMVPLLSLLRPKPYFSYTCPVCRRCIRMEVLASTSRNTRGWDRGE